jgi:hypothetical protein
MTMKQIVVLTLAQIVFMTFGLLLGFIAFMWVVWDHSADKGGSMPKKKLIALAAIETVVIAVAFRLGFGLMILSSWYLGAEFED